MPFTDLYPNGVAVDAGGNVYVTDYLDNRVVKLAAGSGTPTVLPFTGLHVPGLAVDSAGNVYVIDDGQQVVRFAAGSNIPTVLPFTEIDLPRAVGCGYRRDAGADLYVADTNKAGW